MKKYLAIILLSLLFTITSLAQTVGDNTLRLWSSGDWFDDECRSGTCAYAAIQWNPNTLRLSKFIMDNGHLNSVAVQIVFSDAEVLTFVYPTGFYEQQMTGNVNRYIEIIEIAPGDIEIEFFGLSGITFLTCTTDCGGQENVGQIFSMPPGQR